MHSCLYEGTVTHCRYEPVTNQFRYRLYMVYLDLDELPALVGRRGLISDSKRAARSFLHEDHLFDAEQSLTQQVRELIQQTTGESSEGPIRLLTQLRHFGYFMSPLNLFYVFDACDTHVKYIVAEVNNTPWQERHCYLLWSGNADASSEPLAFSHAKDFHVSPFMDMNISYQWQLTAPQDDLRVSLANTCAGETIFDAGLSLKRRELTGNNLQRMTFRYPWMTAQITAGIYFQALKLWWKKCPVYNHPQPQKQVSMPALAHAATAKIPPLP